MSVTPPFVVSMSTPAPFHVFPSSRMRIPPFVDRPWTMLAEHHGTHVVRVTEPGGGDGERGDVAITDLDDIPTPLRGQHGDNPVNRPRDDGVQIELPPRVRGLSPMWWDWEGPGLTPHTNALIDGLVDAVDSWP